jgi:hypothetical protein
MAYNLDELLVKLQEGKPLEKTAEPTPAVTEPTPALAVTEPVVDENAELQKIAAEMDEAGRIIARAFYDELTKIAVGTVGMTPNPDAIPANPGVMVAKVDVKEQDIAKVQQIIQQLTAGERAKGPEGFIQVNGQPVAATEPVNDAATAAASPNVQPGQKTASADVIEKIYSRFFKGE